MVAEGCPYVPISKQASCTSPGSSCYGERSVAPMGETALCIDVDHLSNKGDETKEENNGSEVLMLIKFLRRQKPTAHEKHISVNYPEPSGSNMDVFLTM
jgi:hypothetical protein